MALNTAEIGQQSKGKHGGARPGSGRKLRDMEAWCKVHDIHPATAAQILSNANERRLWYRALSSPDDRIMLDALKFLTVMRDGKPAQRIHVTSTNLTVSVDEIAAARRIVAEILSPALLTSESTGSNQVVNSEEKANASQVVGESDAGSIMLGGGEGRKKDGSG